jgi:YD repeat-containing protein
VTTFTYNDDGTLASLKLHSGDTTTFSYDAYKRPSQVTYPDGKTSQLAYDNRDNLVRATDELGNALALTVDDNGNLRSITDALSATAALNYDSDERVAAAIDPLGKSTNFQYNELGLLKQATDPTGVFRSYGYNSQQRLTSVTNAAGKGVTLSYDREGVPSSLTDALSNTWRFASDKMGRITGVTDPLGGTTAAAYDKLGRLTSATDALGRVITFSYDSRGLLTGVTAPSGVSTSAERNDLGQIAKITDPNGNAWRSNFDAQGRLVSVTDPVGNTTSYSYDSRQRVTQVEVSPSAALAAVAKGLQAGDKVVIPTPPATLRGFYDPLGRLMRRSSSAGDENNYRYDAASRLLQSEGISLGYDPAGNITNSNGTINTFDGAGRLLTTTSGSLTTRWFYSNLGNVSSMQDSAGGTVNFGYNDNGQETNRTYSNSVVTRFFYNGINLPIRIEHAVQGGPLISDAVTLDPAGRRISEILNAPTLPSPANGVNAFAIGAGNQIVGDKYDAQGNNLGNPSQTFTFDGFARLTNIGEGSWRGTYDGLGQLISQTSGGISLEFIRNYAIPGAPIQTVRQNGIDQIYFVWLPTNGTLLYARDAQTNQIQVPLFDLSGNTQAVTGPSGTVQQSFAYSPDGHDVASGGNGNWNLFRWGGQFGSIPAGNTGVFFTPGQPCAGNPSAYPGLFDIRCGEDAYDSTTQSSVNRPSLPTPFLYVGDDRPHRIVSREGQTILNTRWGNGAFYAPLFDAPANVIQYGSISPINIQPFLEKLFVGTTYPALSNPAGPTTFGINNQFGSWGTYVAYYPLSFPIRDPYANAAAPSFPAVPAGSTQWRYIETMYRRGYTKECQQDQQDPQARFCPGRTLTRGEMAVFIIRAKMNNVFPTVISGTPPAGPTVGDTFGDVPGSNPYFSFIQKMRELRITNGQPIVPLPALNLREGGKPGFPIFLGAPVPGAGSDATLTRGQIMTFLIRGFFP